MKNFSTNTTEKALTIVKENHLTVINTIKFKTIRISSKSIFVAIVLTLLNLVI